MLIGFRVIDTRISIELRVSRIQGIGLSLGKEFNGQLPQTLKIGSRRKSSKLECLGLQRDSKVEVPLLEKAHPSCEEALSSGVSAVLRLPRWRWR